MVIVPASAAVAEGLTFTVGQITWTTHGDGLTTTTLEETQIQSGTVEASTPITPTPRTRPSLPRYGAKRVDNSSSPRSCRPQTSRSLQPGGFDFTQARSGGNIKFFRLPSTNSCRHARTTRDIPDNNIDHRGTDCQAQDSLPRPELASWPEQRGRSIFAAHPIPIREHGLVAEPQQACSPSLRQYGLHPHFARRQIRQHKL